jgi:ATP-dependent DNA ligase
MHRSLKPYLPGNRGAWLKTKIMNRQEFVVVGWTDPEGARSSIGSLLLGYYRDDGKLIYAGRVGTGMTQSELRALLKKLRPLAARKMTVDLPPPTTARFGRPLELARVHWVRPELVAEVTFLTWTADGLLRQVVYEGLREDKAARDSARVSAFDSRAIAAGMQTCITRDNRTVNSSSSHDGSAGEAYPDHGMH